MGWRDAVEQVVRDCCLCGSDAEIDTMARTVATLLSAMPPADRIALARELLPEGWVVARDVGASDDTGPNATTAAMVRGWNACRASDAGGGGVMRHSLIGAFVVALIGFTIGWLLGELAARWLFG